MDTLPDGVEVLPLTTHHDPRGSLCEVFRSEWLADRATTQWTLVHSGANAIRGMHCHVLRTDLVTAIDGTLRVVLADVRPGSGSPHLSVVELAHDDPQLLVIPPGVAHAFETVAPTTILCGLDVAWTSSDELGCSWTDPTIADAFVLREPLLSERDATAGTFAELCAAYADAASLTSV